MEIVLVLRKQRGSDTALLLQDKYKIHTNFNAKLFSISCKAKLTETKHLGVKQVQYWNLSVELVNCTCL